MRDVGCDVGADVSVGDIVGVAEIAPHNSIVLQLQMHVHLVLFDIKIV